jgi:hypothetical protein
MQLVFYSMVTWRARRMRPEAETEMPKRARRRAARPEPLVSLAPLTCQNISPGQERFTKMG